MLSAATACENADANAENSSGNAFSSLRSRSQGDYFFAGFIRRGT
jgi:hypothetical protein